MLIKIATPDDAERLVEIYSYYVENTTVTFEYDVPTVEEFRQRIENTLKMFPYLVAEDNGLIIGYCYASPFKTRKAYGWSVETSIYVDKDSHSKGIGTLLYNKLEEYLKKQNIINTNAGISYPNDDSEAFHKKSGYKKVAHFEKVGYKLGKWVDVIWMEKSIGEHTDNPKEVILFSELKK